MKESASWPVVKYVYTITFLTQRVSLYLDSKIPEWPFSKSMLSYASVDRLMGLLIFCSAKPRMSGLVKV